MASKKGIVLYYDILEQLEDLTDEQFGKLTREIIKYDKTGQVPQFNDLSMKVAFKMLKPILDKNKQDYEDICEKNRQNIQKRWQKQDTTVYDRISGNTKNTDNDKDNDKDKDIKKEIYKERKFVPPTFDEVLEYAKSKGRIDIAKNFYDYFTEGKWVDSKGNKVKNWKQKILTWMAHDKEFGILSANDKNKTDMSFRRNYTKEEMNSMFDDIEDIDI